MLKAIVNGRIYSEFEFLDDYVLVYNDKISAISEHKEIIKTCDEVIDANGDYVLPGFIDVHIHGYFGVDTMDGDVDGLLLMGREIAKNGVTSYLPTTMNMSKKDIIRALKSVEKAKTIDNEGAQILGVHLEGPFINKKYKGAQPEQFVIHPDMTWLEDYIDLIKIITFAPEIEGARELITQYKDSINFSIGHSGASYEESLEAFKVGAKGVTHLFNAMTGLHHRHPGVVGAALTSDGFVELIADTYHVRKELFEFLLNQIGNERLLLITDCIRGGGLQDGVYTLGGQKVYVNKGKCLLENGTIAGSVLKMHEGLKNFSNNVKVDLQTLIPLVTLNQAKYLSIDDQKGSLAVNKDADIVIMTETFDIVKTIVKGRTVYEV